MTADADELDALPAEDDLASIGAAAESAEWDESLKLLPRILRYAVLASRGNLDIRERLVAEIAELAPGMVQTVAWAEGTDPDLGVALAAELDRLAATNDRPDLRSLADCVRISEPAAARRRCLRQRPSPGGKGAGAGDQPASVR